VHKADHFGHYFDGCQALVSGCCFIKALFFKVIKKVQNQLIREVTDLERSDLDAIVVNRKREQEGINDKNSLSMHNCI